MKNNVYLNSSLPAHSENIAHINAGDIMLYGSDCIVVFYESFDTAYSYTPIGKLDNADEVSEFSNDEIVNVSFKFAEK